MIQELLAAMPKEAGTLALGIALIGAIFGAGVWLVGARFSRSIVTLAMTSLGAVVGMRVPGWFGWPLDAWAGGVGGAIVLGVCGYVMHRWWVGVGLGLILASWAALGTWHFARGTAAVQWPAFDAATLAMPAFAIALWKALPADVTKYLPYACGTAFVSGVIGGVIWPRVGVILLYTLLGVSMLVSMGLMSMEMGRPHWIDMLPAGMQGQMLTLGGLVAFGALVQWRVTRTPGAPAKVDTKA